MSQNIVAHFLDGTIVKGKSTDFFPNRPVFHLLPLDGGAPMAISVADLKGLFTVKTFEGSPEDRSREDVDRAGLGRKIKVTFKDGEVLVGYTSGYSPDRAAFFVFPADPDSNTERAFVNTAATTSVEFV